jgi:uncharacterized protein (TIGR00369 family)
MLSETHERALSIAWEDPMVVATAARGMSGLSFLEAIKKGEVPLPPICELVGFEPAEVEETRVVFECVPGEQHYNPIGAVHGGLACILLDSAMGCAVHSTLPPGAGYTTLELKANMLRPITMSTGRLLCEGRTIYVGGRVATAEGRLTDEVGKLYAHGTATCMVFRPEEEPAEGEPGG